MIPDLPSGTLRTGSTFPGSFLLLTRAFFPSTHSQPVSSYARVSRSSLESMEVPVIRCATKRKKYVLQLHLWNHELILVLGKEPEIVEQVDLLLWCGGRVYDALKPCGTARGIRYITQEFWGDVQVPPRMTGERNCVIVSQRQRAVPYTNPD